MCYPLVVGRYVSNFRLLLVAHTTIKLLMSCDEPYVDVVTCSWLPWLPQHLHTADMLQVSSVTNSFSSCSLMYAVESNVQESCRSLLLFQNLNVCAVCNLLFYIRMLLCRTKLVCYIVFVVSFIPFLVGILR